tara:strand:+ start:164982 stop:165227 length:246 start_codon:yes stop_codon:yes gene_type:complete
MATDSTFAVGAIEPHTTDNASAKGRDVSQRNHENNGKLKRCGTTQRAVCYSEFAKTLLFTARVLMKKKPTQLRGEDKSYKI